MRGRVAGAVLWCVATAGATLLVQAGVGTIRTATRSDTVLDVQSTSPAGASRGTVGPPASTTSAANGGLESPTPTTTSTPATTVAPPATSPVPRPSEAPPTTPPPTITAAAPPASAITRTVSSRGGTATIRFRPDEVSVVVATPNAGYTAEISRRSATAVRVEFENENENDESRIDASWQGEPQVEVRES